ncbi:sugar phosphate nucleotidyltransferase, partial [Francisella tularensis]|uniref:sugar phosphate nucleotidyltransferase n=1 Tax=Francisella tularensis TaxID=263 RepID=UPI002381B240
HQAIEKAQQIVIKDDSLVNFVITPSCPHEGFGYIKQGVQNTVNGVYKVDTFVEKHSAVVEKEYLDSGKYYWNSGMFMF